MNLRQVWQIARPILMEGLRLYAPQIKIPADILGYATKHLGKAKKGTKKIKKRIFQLDNMISEAEDALALLKSEKQTLTLKWGDLDGLVEQIRQYVEKNG